MGTSQEATSDSQELFFLPNLPDLPGTRPTPTTSSMTSPTGWPGMTLAAGSPFQQRSPARRDGEPMMWPGLTLQQQYGLTSSGSVDPPGDHARNLSVASTTECTSKPGTVKIPLTAAEHHQLLFGWDSVDGMSVFDRSSRQDLTGPTQPELSELSVTGKTSASMLESEATRVLRSRRSQRVATPPSEQDLDTPLASLPRSNRVMRPSLHECTSPSAKESGNQILQPAHGRQERLHSRLTDSVKRDFDKLSSAQQEGLEQLRDRLPARLPRQRLLSQCSASSTSPEVHLSEMCDAHLIARTLGLRQETQQAAVAQLRVPCTALALDNYCLAMVASLMTLPGELNATKLSAAIDAAACALAPHELEVVRPIALLHAPEMLRSPGKSSDLAPDGSVLDLSIIDGWLTLMTLLLATTGAYTHYRQGTDASCSTCGCVQWIALIAVYVIQFALMYRK